MSVKSSNIVTTDLDFDDIVSNIKNYLKGQERFKDYDFEANQHRCINRYDGITITYKWCKHKHSSFRTIFRFSTIKKKCGVSCKRFGIYSCIRKGISSSMRY